jgi:hypothetical protein
MTDKNAAPLNHLFFEDSFFPALRDTDVTLRRGELNVLTGAFNFVARKSGEIMPVQVTAVECKPFRELADEIFVRDGKGSKEQTFKDMSRFYPDMTEDSKITVISYRVKP